MQTRPTPWYQRLLVLSLILNVLASQSLPLAPLAQALTAIRTVDESDALSNPGGGAAEIRNVGSVETRYGLVAILVDEATWNASSTSDGGAFAFLGNTRLSEKIQTYAADVQSAVPWTKSIILTVAPEDTPADIQRMLERFYFEGNPEDNDFTQLSGVVVIGDVPLPVVNKNGNHFLSMLPYTDFQDPAYIFDEDTQDFLPNRVGQELQPEVWHGLMVPPLGGQEGIDLLADYFVKNHAFHTGDESYTRFDKQVFVGDFVTEEDTLNPVSYDSYARYLDLWEEMVYYRYTNDLVEAIYTDLADSVEPGDQLDNDGDGRIDEEAANGKDDDGDGLVDEDIGDGFYGIDNDGDGLIDEDTFQDNNNDEGWVIDIYLGEGSGEKLFQDRAVDEDPPGDITGGPDANEDGIPDGDGCPGICGVDDNGDAQDHDGDGYPTGWEILFGYDPFDERKPHRRVHKKLNGMGIYPQTFADEEEATAYLEALFTDGTHGYQHSSCYDDAGAFHGEWDDDEDGFCDEDGSDQIQLWANDQGVPAFGNCAYNDADCDGLIDEDSEGIRPESQFELLPDIQAQPIVDSLTHRYSEIFDQPLGVWNRMVEGTGRYEREDYASAISLIAKKDEYVMQYLKEANDALESELNALVRDELQDSIPMVAMLRIRGEITYLDASGTEVTEDICTLDLDPDKPKACLQFVNHSVEPPVANANFKYKDFDDGVSDAAQAERFYMYGVNMWDIHDANFCDFFAGTNEEGGQITEINALYDPLPSTLSVDLSRGEIKDKTNCLAENAPYQEDIPELCDPLVATDSVRSVAGAKAVNPEENRLYTLDTGFAACYEFRELETYIDYYDNRNFNDWLTGQLRRFRKEDDVDDAETYEAFLEDVETKRASDFPNAGTTPERASFGALNVLTQPGFTYTVRQFFNDLGYEDFTADDIDAFMAFIDDDTPVTVNRPASGRGLDQVSSVTLYFDKLYLEDTEAERGNLVDDQEDARRLPSNTLHIEPTSTTLNAQSKAIASPNLPIDATRRVSFKDSADLSHELNYVNLFDAQSLADVEAQLNTLSEAVGAVSNGASHTDDVLQFMNLLNVDQLVDALEWAHMSIDEKHHYVLTHYLGDEEPIVGKNAFRDGFEMVSLIVDGQADSLNFGFNGSAPVTEEDLEWNYRSQEAIDAALANAAAQQPSYEALGGGPHFTPVPLFEWVQEIQDWLKDVNDSVSSFDTFDGGGLQCGAPINLHPGGDSDGDGVPDSAESSVGLRLGTDQHRVLQANGRENLVVTVSALDATGQINFDDNFTQVELEILSGDGVVDILGSSSLTVNGGVAVFLLKSGEAGDFTLRARQDNSPGVSVSNTLEGSVTEKLVKVSTFVTENNSNEAELQAGDRIEVRDESGRLLALLDPESGDLVLREGQAELREAESTLPTRVAILNAAGESQGVFYLIPSSPEAVSVQALAPNARVEGENLLLGERIIGVVNAQGQIAVDVGYQLAFEDLNALNIFDPIHILDASLNTVFTVRLAHEGTDIQLEVPRGIYQNYLSFDSSLGSPKTSRLLQLPRIPVAKANVAIPDSDQDLLDDLEEWTIGTDRYNADSDGDGFQDGEEIFSGFDPLKGNEARLFKDMDSSHPAYHDLAVLYLRGVIQGFGDGSFRPENSMTREEFVKIDLGSVCVACDRFDPAYEAELFASYNEDPFPDSNINSELLACVAEAKEEGIVSGFEAGDQAGFFVPKQSITRAEATKILVETAGLSVGALQAGEKWYAAYVRAAELAEIFPSGVTVDTAWLQGAITRAEFVSMAVNALKGNDCRELDNDSDALSNGEEVTLYGTDPNLADSDGGGVQDLEEILRGSDPLDPSDDFPAQTTPELPAEIPTADFEFDSQFQHAPGLYSVSNHADYETVTVNADSGAGEVNVFTREVPADGQSTLFVRAEIRDQSNNIYVDDNTSVIEFILSSESFGTLQSRTVQVNKGTAETTFESSEMAGDVQVEARITDGSLPSRDALIRVVAGEPVRVSMTGESTLLPAGAESVTHMQVELLDAFGNRANNGFYTLTLEAEGGMEILDVFDEDLEQSGLQVTTPDGFLDLRVLASPNIGVSTVKASLAGIPESGSQFSVTHINNMQLVLETTQPYMFAGSEGSQSIQIEAQSSVGQVLTGFQGTVNLRVNDAAYGGFTESQVTLVNGQASANFKVGTLAGNGNLLVESPGVESGSLNLEVKAAAPYELRLRNLNGDSILQAGSQATFVVEALDVFGNLVDTDSSTSGTLRATESTAPYASLSSTSFLLNQGQARFTVDIGEVSGVLNLVAASGSLLAGTWGGPIEYSLSGEAVASIAPQMLYASILGGPFGDVTQENYVGGWMTFQGKTQAVTSLLSEPIPKKRRVSIDAEGSISLPQDGLVSQNISGAGQSLPLRLEWRNVPGDELIAEVFYVIPQNPGEVQSSLLSVNPKFSLESFNGGTLLREDAAAAVKVRADGQIVLMDPAYHLAVNAAAEGLGFIVLRGRDEIMRVDFGSDWEKDVSLLSQNFNLENWRTLDPGIYLKPSVYSEHDFVSVPTGNSSKNPLGLAFVDPNQDLSQDMRPSLGYASLESAETNGSVGWETENKHLMLFAAGNTVGQSNLFYPSEVGTVLGDPTIRLVEANEVNDLGYTTDIGTMVSAGQEDILSLVKIDYNGDGMEDVLKAYANGRIEVLQNTEAPLRLQDQGSLLFVENGIRSVDTGDFNGDGLEDLLVVTETSCYADEMCLYIYENIGGGFVAENLTVEGVSGKVRQVVVSDLNQDRYDDLVLVDENMKLYVVWNAKGRFGSMDLIQDFGLTADPSINLYGDVALGFEGLDKTSITLPVRGNASLPRDPVIDADVQDFIDGLKIRDDFSITVNELSPDAPVQATEDQGFEAANTSVMTPLFQVEKRVEDLNGGSINLGDRLRYHIEVSNISGQAFTDLYVTDSLGDYFQFDKNSFLCEACTGGELQAGSNTRPWVYGPQALRNGGTLSFDYEVTVQHLPGMEVLVGQDFYEDYTQDNLPDIAVSLEGNVSGELMLYYSDGVIRESIDGAGLLGLFDGSYDRVVYREKEYSPDTHDYTSDTEVEDPYEDADEDGIPDFMQTMDPEKGFPVPNGSIDPFEEIFGATDKNGDGYYSNTELFSSDADADNDGLLDTVDEWISTANLLLDPSLDLDPDAVVLSSALDAEVAAEIELFDEEVEQITNVVEDVVNALTCNGGCIAFPGSISFLTPGMFHDPLTGLPTAPDLGMPVFGILPVPPGVCTGSLCQPASTFRMYLSPTTTLGLGVAVCPGPWLGSFCFAYSVPVLQATGLCDAINGFIADSLSKATAFVAGDDNKIFNVHSDPQDQSSESGFNSSIFDDYKPPVATNVNIQVPGFPAVFTEWWKAQQYEFFKMLDLPDVTFIYPDPASIASEFNVKENQANGEDTVQLETDILGLEKLLNSAHAFPLIDIQPEQVDIHYPDLTKEELEIIRRDWEDWVQDTRNEWDRFKAQFELRRQLAEGVSAAEEKIYGEIEDVIEELLLGMEANLAVLESYVEIPQQILKLRELQTYYAKIIICYLDAVLSYTAGYLAENADRIEGWAQWVVDLQGVLDGWQILLDLAIDLMQSCDKCTNQRYSGIQLLLSLFVFIPEFPVVEFPSLPDIVIDVSDVQAGVDIVWPDLNFIPERLDIPEIPRITLPSAYLEGDLDLDLNLPVLPEFPILFELTPPTLSLPELPSLPPPPDIPDLSPSIKASLNVASDILNVVCLVRNGFMPVPEHMLKTKIEEITERSGGIILPIDLAIQVEWPAFRKDFLEEIQVITTLNLTADFSTLFDLVDAFGEQSNDFVGDVMGSLEDELNAVRDKIQSVIDPFNGLEFGVEGDAEVELDLESYNETHPAIETALAYKDHPMVQENLMALTQLFEGLQVQLEAWDATLPEDVTLVATERVLDAEDPLLHRYDEILQEGRILDPSFIASIDQTPLANVALLRDSMIAYVEDFDAGTQRLNTMDGEAFNRYLAQESNHQDVLLAAEASAAELPSLLPESDSSVQLAAEGSVDATAAAENLNLGGEALAFNTGLFIQNTEAGIATRLIDYVQEADAQIHILLMDVDQDGDEDVVYSMGGDVYMKENHLRNASVRYFNGDPEQSSVFEMNPAQGSVKNIRPGKNNYEEASFAFTASPNAVGYEALLYDALDAAESSPEENVRRILLLERDQNPSLPFTDPDGESFQKSQALVAEGQSRLFQGGTDLSILVPSKHSFTLPEIRESRLVVDKVSGRVKLFQAPERTRLGQNVEISLEESVLLQSTKKTLLKVSVDGKTTNVELPAYASIQFGARSGRVIRIESGEVLWIDPNSILEEQNVVEGMELFQDELVELESAGAQMTLLSSEGAEMELDRQESFVMDQLLSPENPSSSIAIENGAYYTVLRGLFEDGSVGTASRTILLNPQVCGDDSAPFPIIDTGSVSNQSIDLPIFATTTLSAESSFDSDSEIIDAYWDMDASVDVDGDGVANNDQEVVGLMGEIGPYDSVEPKEVTLWLTDAAGNQSSATVTVNIFVPDLILDTASSVAVEGSTLPLSPEMPYYLVRDRKGALSELGEQRVTDEDGLIYADDFEDSDLLSIYNSNKQLIAEFNPRTRQILVLDDRYAVEAIAANANWPTHLAVYELSTGLVSSSFILVSDTEGFVTQLFEPLEAYDLSLQENLTVHVLADSGYEVNESGVFGRNALGFTQLTIAPDGSITLLDPQLELRKREADSLDDYLILEVWDGDELAVEIWPGGPVELNVLSTEDLDLPASPYLGEHESIRADFRLQFEDISMEDELYDNIAELVERGILEGFEEAGLRYFKPDQAITRAEFTKIILSILCIVPREEASLAPPVFNDIQNLNAWYYPYTKESFLRDLITGYLGEVDAAGEAPFKPNQTITRAEASKIVLEALDKEAVIELSGNLQGSPWYAPYMELALENGVITETEANSPNHVLTRYEFVEMAARVLEIHNCFDLDSDGDGLINYDEEAVYSTDPYNPDTDDGGVPDGIEVNRGSDPLDASDDFEPGLIFEVEPGIYAVQEACNACPCSALVDYQADLRLGDEIFAIIRNELGEIFSVSNRLSVSEPTN